MVSTVVYVPIGVSTYHMEKADEQFRRSVDLLKSVRNDIVCPQDKLFSLDALTLYLDTVLTPDLVILQNITFANAAFASEILRRYDCPIVLWTLREPPSGGGRLRLNSLTGAYSAANAIHAFRGNEKFQYVFGGPDEENVKEEISAIICTVDVLVKVRNLRMAAIGHTPQGFGFGRALDSEIMKNFGVTLDSIEARELIDVAKSYSDNEIASVIEEAGKMLRGLENTPEKNVKDFARLLKAYRAYVKNNNIGALASRCWPDFFTTYGTPVCTVLSILNTEGIIASCENDIYGALSMYIGYCLAGVPSFFGDPVAMDEKENTITYWHCGMAACSLAREDTGACVGVHPNRKIGPTMEFGCRPCDKVTIFRVGRNPDGTFRFFIASGKALDKPKQFLGTSVVVQTDGSAEKIVKETIRNGWEPHYAVIYGECARQLEILADMLHMEAVKYI